MPMIMGTLEEKVSISFWDMPRMSNCTEHTWHVYGKGLPAKPCDIWVKNEQQLSTLEKPEAKKAITHVNQKGKINANIRGNQKISKPELLILK